ncbi:MULTISPECIES: FmdE family protein [unclassified Prosthecochloris]|uniref:FmdE family protein n=1 Tax=unclassified Prosthecochloris TaxID=2632826 RepID=UPI00223DF3C7|nr:MULTISPECIES: FmdE family protein [unclassified Prosthecochloris]UZJ40354.1 FmdE family protein [Prosthecochloris sp. SCSIO W1101]
MKINVVVVALLAVLMLPVRTNGESKTSRQSVYQKAGTISVIDPKAVIVGYRNPEDAVFTLSLDDVGKYTGHVCAGVASGFLLTAKALDLLYPGDEMPVRGQISMAVSRFNDQAEVAAYVIRARTDEGDEKENNALIIDPGLAASLPQSFVVIFKRMDNGRMVKAVLDETKLACNNMTGVARALKSKVMSGSATDAEKQQFANSVQQIVAKVIADTPTGLLSVSECSAEKDCGKPFKK